MLQRLPPVQRIPRSDLSRSFKPIISPFHTHPISLHFNLNLNLNRTWKSSSAHLSRCFTPSSASPIDDGNHIDAADDFGVELGRLLVLLPEEMRRRVEEHPEFQNLIEIVMDLGRKPLARFSSGDFLLSHLPITFHHLQHATSQVGDFATDNRAGISRTLHRISAIRNRRGVIIGLTCRVGRAMPGTANLLRDLVEDGGSLLLIGPPGVGKTTIIREIARMLADDYGKRVMIVDTSNEIGGDGDIPHAGIGGARRMPVPDSDMQHKVLIEAVENHMPQVIVIDEIGTKLEAMAASTIAQRGIQLVATAHGVTIENLTMNPSLEMLVGGIQSVTLGDEEASRRGVQKTVLERRGPPTFTCGVEIISKTELRVHRCLEATVDALLSGRSPPFEVRSLNTQGLANDTVEGVEDYYIDSDPQKQDKITSRSSDPLVLNGELGQSELTYADDLLESSPPEDAIPICLYSYGILETSIMQAIKQLGLDETIRLTDNISEAHALLGLHSKLKKNSRIQAVAKSHIIPIYVTKTSSLLQIRKAIRAFMSERANGIQDSQGQNDSLSSSEKIDALEEARLAIEQVVIPRGEPVELLPRPPAIISLQTKFIKNYQLQPKKTGKEPNIRLWILPLQASKTEKIIRKDETVDKLTEDDVIDKLTSTDEFNGSHGSITRLPLLPG